MIQTAVREDSVQQVKNNIADKISDVAVAQCIFMQAIKYILLQTLFLGSFSNIGVRFFSRKLPQNDN